MTCHRPARSWILLLLLIPGLGGGCAPAGDSGQDEEKESNFLTGKNLAGQGDYAGAVDAYEKALETNPRNSSAHFEAALLYEDQIHDPAVAIYHFERFLKLRPDSGKDLWVKERINACRMDLAKAVSAPMQGGAPHDWEKVMEENRELKDQLAQMRASAAAMQAAPATNPPARPVPPVPDQPRSAAGPPPSDIRRTPAPTATYPSMPARVNVPSASRTYTVKPGETMAAVARKYNVPLPAILAANPQVNPKRMPAGQVLNIPPP